MIDIADPETWPSLLVAEIRVLSDMARREVDLDDDFPVTDLALELDPVGEIEDRVRALLADAGLRMFHASRLLPHEMENIQGRGLLPLSDELLRERAYGASRHHPDLVSVEEASLLLENGPLHWQGTKAVRLGIRHLVAPLAAVGHHGMQRFFTDWGGEALAWQDESIDGRRCEEICRRLSAVSLPVVVEVAPTARELCDYAYLWPQFVGVLLGLRVGNEWTVAVPLEVTQLIFPSHPVWDPEWEGT